jgi:DNA-binding transcriptional LysR family regulator
MVEFGNLEALVAVARERSFGRAAERLSRTQPAVSIAIGKLEEEVGASLFDRFRRDVRLTAAGQILFEYAQKILNLRVEAGQAIEELRQLHRGKVTIGANESTSLYLLPRIILEFRERHPDIKVEVFHSSSVQLPQEIKERNLDFGIIAFDPSDKELESFPILRDELILILWPYHRLAKQHKVSFKELGKESFVAHNVKSPSRDYVVEAFRKRRVPLNIGIELSSIETIKQFVEMKLGIAIVPRLSVEQELRQKKLVTITLEGFQHRRTLSVISLRSKIYSHAARAFLDVLRNLPPE